ncbi:Barstar, RNAse (barnase) inhibitor [Cylindrospermum stagnale PCC 7417]|uniref:Barstar, RNAse (Barnase) inhibitor n=1 Tax=Cylindrospermum stagnale PCC 7417 TaxID=56107 RepID=K9WXD4_9NOST|nr:barstar family protein [Cylindrospermum stagnale]AFZ24157.1 Barstar, RNAse (barnase) inhibitor [Cylindrospermum stagnale PCC 7417]
MEILLDGKAIFTEYDFHRQIAQLLDFGEYYGNNLDALWDVLTTVVERPVNLIWYNSAISHKNLGGETFQKIVKALQSVQASDQKMGWDTRFEFELC